MMIVRAWESKGAYLFKMMKVNSCANGAQQLLVNARLKQKHFKNIMKSSMQWNYVNVLEMANPAKIMVYVKIKDMIFQNVWTKEIDGQRRIDAIGVQETLMSVKI